MFVFCREQCLVLDNAAVVKEALGDLDFKHALEAVQQRLTAETSGNSAAYVTTLLFLHMCKVFVVNWTPCKRQVNLSQLN